MATGKIYKLNLNIYEKAWIKISFQSHYIPSIVFSNWSNKLQSLVFQSFQGVIGASKIFEKQQKSTEFFLLYTVYISILFTVKRKVAVQ